MKFYCGWHMVIVIKVQEPCSQSFWRGFNLQAPLSLLQCTEILNFAINPESVTCWRRTSMKQNVLCFSFQLLGWHTCLIYGRILGPGQDAYPRLEMCQPGLRKFSLSHSCLFGLAATFYVGKMDPGTWSGCIPKIRNVPAWTQKFFTLPFMPLCPGCHIFLQ